MTKMKNKIAFETKSFHGLRTWTGEKSDGEQYIMGFVYFKEDGAPLRDREQLVAFDPDVIEELKGAGRGDTVDLEVQYGEKGPIILDAEVVS